MEFAAIQVGEGRGGEYSAHQIHGMTKMQQVCRLDPSFLDPKGKCVVLNGNAVSDCTNGKILNCNITFSQWSSALRIMVKTCGETRRLMDQNLLFLCSI